MAMHQPEITYIVLVLRSRGSSLSEHSNIIRCQDHTGIQYEKWDRGHLRFR